jgi:hypothetical protein
MQATRTSAGRADAPRPPRHQHRGSPPAPSPAGPGTRFLDLRSEEEFLSRFGDAIDDRIAETLDELLEERNATRQHRRLPRALGTVSLILALAASVLLQHSAIAAWTIWPATAVICLAAAWATSSGRSLSFAGNDIHGRPGAYLSRREQTRARCQVPVGFHDVVVVFDLRFHGWPGDWRTASPTLTAGRIRPG